MRTNERDVHGLERGAQRAIPADEVLVELADVPDLRAGPNDPHPALVAPQGVDQRSSARLAFVGGEE
ncbi:hypothetical protein WBQ80_07520 [Agromyces sp. CCNWLW213]|uniref:hypothetical protein n=1 Tax=Agromyces sp. CCNWLW213 TaxID=3128541 RepID=UPI00307637C5